MSPLGAILLAGGRGTRVGGAAKPLFEVGGRTLLARAVDAAHAAGCEPITVAGPAFDPRMPVRWAREDPPFTGPAAAVVAALATWPDDGPEWTLMLACDLADPERATRRLLADAPLLPGDADGICLGDASSRPQWLTGLYRTAPLRAAASGLPDAGRDQPVRALLADLAITVVNDPDGGADIDTWEDLTRAKERFDG